MSSWVDRRGGAEWPCPWGGAGDAAPDGGLRFLGPGQDEGALVLHDPFEDLALRELHRLGERRRDVDVPLSALLALDQRHRGRVAQVGLLSVSSYITR